MSDGFDKEAEREKLREKLADDDEKREHTQRMSELLLQQGDDDEPPLRRLRRSHPIFRHDGQEFCPSCQDRLGRRARGESQESAQTAALEEAGNAPRTVVKTGDSDESPPQKERDASESPAADQSAPASASQNSATSNAVSPQPTTEKSRDDPTTTPPAESAGSETVADARASLTRTLARRGSPARPRRRTTRDARATTCRRRARRRRRWRRWTDATSLSALEDEPVVVRREVDLLREVGSLASSTARRVASGERRRSVGGPLGSPPIIVSSRGRSRQFTTANRPSTASAAATASTNAVRSSIP